MNRVLSLAFGVVLVACGTSAADSAAPSGDPKPAPAPSSTSAKPAGAPPAASVEAPCDGGVTETCSAWNERSVCVVVDGERTWKKETCAEGCFAGKCSPTACVDECAAGEAGCELWDMKSKAFVEAEPAASMHDRARDYGARLRSTSLVYGQVLNVWYTDETRTAVAAYSGQRDAAIWTGSALAAEAWRLMATRSPDAAARVDALVRTLHRDFEIAGDPGYFARYVMPKSEPAVKYADNPTCASEDWHCGRPYQGQTYDWIGGTSRDQYTGVVLGYTMAYLATTDEALKKIIRGDMVQIAVELAKQRKGVPVSFFKDGIKITKAIDIENVILAPSEMKDGSIIVDLSGGVAETGTSGMREFLPDFAMLTKPLLGIGIPVPRNGSAIMLGAIFESALMMSADSTDPFMKTAHQELAAYYQAHAADWAKIGKAWTFETRDGCGQGYYSTHIAYIMGYVWASLVKDPALVPTVKDEIFHQAMWGGVQLHKNAYFAFLWGGTRNDVTSGASAIGAASTQLAQFTPGPRVMVPRDSRDDPAYLPHDTKCTAEPLVNIETSAVDVKDRRVDDFIWQRQPWQLYDGGITRLVFPGVDYLAAYWAARRHGFLEDDRAGTCARKAP